MQDSVGSYIIFWLVHTTDWFMQDYHARFSCNSVKFLTDHKFLLKILNKS